MHDHYPTCELPSLSILSYLFWYCLAFFKVCVLRRDEKTNDTEFSAHEAFIVHVVT